jgi:hypothetical protein
VNLKQKDFLKHVSYILNNFTNCPLNIPLDKREAVFLGKVLPEVQN